MDSCGYGGKIRYTAPYDWDLATPLISKITPSTTCSLLICFSTPGNHSPVPHHSTSSSSNGPVKDSRQSFPTAIVGSVIGVILLSTCIVILACIWKRRKRGQKPRYCTFISLNIWQVFFDGYNYVLCQCHCHHFHHRHHRYFLHILTAITALITS